MKGGQQTQNLTQQEYVIRINEMSKEMIQAWKNDQRVKTLKIVIQVREKKYFLLQFFLLQSLGLQIISRYECVGILSK